MEDMLKMMEQAKELSKIFSGGQDDGGDSGGMDMEQMLKMAETIKLIQTMMPEDESGADRNLQQENPEGGAKAEAAYFDDGLTPPAIKTIKSALPFLEARFQRPLGIAVKAIELQKVVESFSDQAIAIQSARDDNWRKGMLLAIKPHMDEEKKHMIDLLIKIMDIKEISAHINRMRGEASGINMGK